MDPRPHCVEWRRDVAPEVVTLSVSPLEPETDAPPHPTPGQFSMLWSFGVGEAPISVSGRAHQHLEFTIRSVGAVTAALCDSRPGDVVGVRGPFGTGWTLPDDGDLLIVAGGLGLAPLRLAVLKAIEQRDRYDSVSVVVGARSPADLLFTDELVAWGERGLDVQSTVDTAPTSWSGEVGMVTKLVDRLSYDPDRVTALVCGPEVMMRVVADRLTDAGVSRGRIQLSLERNMQCAISQCGHCQLGAEFVCADGPVFPLDRIHHLIATREL